ncbi:glycosyltransferase [Anaerocolumna sedimenticola]|uniref:Glycosyltransferase n=1 Tax=Anaerocolumna sedimenticola TaxID=2696063 RepID=A0A6P1TKW4_9FIRM|nr:glycosyltransferase [Anaerocolumna sedimenticola]QHQ61073.1 glycosyltransferase [Anaerocolumna sedimenticola]
MERFFPDIKYVSFLPLAGTQITDNYIPYTARKYDIVFTGNYTPPHTFDKYINRIDDDYSLFYHNIIDNLINNPDKTIEEAIEYQTRAEINDLTEEDLKNAMASMIFIDLYVRFHFRALAVQTLVDNGFRVDVFGKGWDLLECRNKSNLIIHGGIESQECILNMLDSRISLNVMPWFKAGAHDRIFNTMLSKSVSLSDGSTYITDQFNEGKEIVLYSLSSMDKLPKIAGDLLSDPDKAAGIAEAGYQKSRILHSWKNRAEALSEYINRVWFWI